MEQLTFVLDDFDGPLDLLLSLISKNKMNIYDIPIASLVEQYMLYIEQAQKMDMEIAGEFIAMASYLMALKSKTLLPRTENDKEDPRAELAQMLLEYKRAKESVPYFLEAFAKYGGRYAKDTEEISASDGPFEGKFDISVLTDAFARVLIKIKESEEANNTSKKPFDAILNKYVKPVDEMMVVLEDTLKTRGKIKFDELMSVSKTRSELVAAFLAVLEMLRDQKLLLEISDEICYIEINENYVGDDDDGKPAINEEYD